MWSPSMHGEATGRQAYVWSLTLRDLLLIALVAALCMLAKQLLRLPVNVPGHSGVLWVALFVICRGLVDKRGTGVLLGLVAGLLAQFAGFGQGAVRVDQVAGRRRHPRAVDAGVARRSAQLLARRRSSAPACTSASWPL